MSKLTKEQAKLHRQACELLAVERPLTYDEAWFVLEHWQESSTAANALEGAFFTPLGLAHDLAAAEVPDDCGRILDLCAGIGRLAWFARHANGRRLNNIPPADLVCVERNPAYVQAGRRVLPEATWICADVFDLPRMGLGRFDVVVSNPPFGATPRSGNGPRYRSRRAEYHVLDIAADLAPRGVFIVPQDSAPFRNSGLPNLKWDRRAEHEQFEKLTGIVLGPGIGFDASYYAGDWNGVAPKVEVVVADFSGRIAVPPPAVEPQQSARQRPAGDIGEQLVLL